MTPQPTALKPPSTALTSPAQEPPALRAVGLRNTCLRAGVRAEVIGQSVGSDASPLSCFLFRPRKSCEKRRKRSHTNVSMHRSYGLQGSLKRRYKHPSPTSINGYHAAKKLLSQSPAKRPTFAFAGESGYTLAFAQRIAHSGSHAETRAFRTGVVSLPSERFARFGSPAWPGVRTAYFAALGSWPGGALEERRKPSGQRCAYACRCPEGVAAPLGCVIFLQFGDVAVFSLCTQYFTQNFLRVQDEGGITTLVLLRVLLKRWTAACQKDSCAAFCDEICQG